MECYNKEAMIEVKKENGLHNVLIVHNYYQISGGEDTVVANEMEMLQKHGHKVVLYTRDNSEIRTMNKRSKLLLPFTTVFSLKTYKEIKRIIKTEDIDIVHVHNTLSLISPSVYYAARKCGVPIVQTIHNFRLLCPGATFYRDGHICEDCLQKGLISALRYNCYRGSKAQTFACVFSTMLHRMTGIYGRINYICLTNFNKEKLLQLKQIKSEHVYVKPNFVECKEIFIPEEKRLNQFIYAGRLDKLKGIDVLFSAWKKMGKDAPKLLVCGTGSMDEWCREFIKKNNCNIEMKGFVANSEARKLIAESRGLILPTQWYEGFPMTIVEAFSVGTPVVCSNLGNAGNIVTEGISGCKFAADNTDELIDAVFRCNDLCETTKAEYISKYTLELNYATQKSIYDSVRFL